MHFPLSVWGAVVERVYLDWNASAPLRPEALAAMAGAWELTGNPSSVHAEGRKLRGIIERARGQVAGLVGCKPSEVVFTSGATEAATLLRHVPEGCGVIVDETAHDCLWAHKTAPEEKNVLAIGYANSETGVLSPVPQKGETGWSHNGVSCNWLLLDVVQAVGRVPFSFHWSGADFAILSAHKLGGPKGVGALIVREGLDFEAILLGGGQELGRRSGTENAAGIAGFGAAAEAALTELNAGAWDRVAKLRNILEKALAVAEKEIIFVGNEFERLPNTTCFVTAGWKGETQVMQMDLAGFAVSAGSACSSGKVKVPRVLNAMGLDADLAECALRVSLGPTTTEAAVMGFVEAWTAERKKRRQRAA